MTKLKYDDKTVEAILLDVFTGDEIPALELFSKLQEFLDNTPPEYYENVIVIPKCEEGYEGECNPYLAVYYLREKSFYEINKERLKQIENLKCFIKVSEQEIVSIEKELVK